MTFAQSYVDFGIVAKLVAAEAAVIPGWTGKGRTARTHEPVCWQKSAHKYK